MYPQRNNNHRSHSGGLRRGGSRARPQRTFDHSLFIKSATGQDAEQYSSKHKFSDFPFAEQIQRNIIAHKYITPTPIQDQAIPALLEGRDMVGIASTGTGKTAAFLLPLIQKVLTDRLQKVLIIAPTRELALQIEDELWAFAKDLRILSVLCIGGMSMNRQIYGLRRNPNFVIGTPGRLIDLQEQGKLRFSEYKSIVLDEVDRMLDMGFIHDIKRIIAKLPAERHSLFFSATIPDSIRDIMNQFLKNPVTVAIKAQQASENVNQNIVRTNGKQKIDILHELLIQDGFDKVLLFGRTKWGIEKLAKQLVDRGFKVAAIHGNKRQTQRQRALDDFKSNAVQVLLATDIASRGIDVNDITHVINYDLPESYEDYIHRIGRTGRANKIGTALTFVD